MSTEQEQEQLTHRLAQSRQRLASALLETAHRPSAPAPAATALLVEALLDGWTRHPLHVGGQVALGVANGVLQPMARRHPWGLVVGSALVGVVLAGSHPWRWAIRPALQSGWMRQMVQDVVLRALSRQPKPSSSPFSSV